MRNLVFSGIAVALLFSACAPTLQRPDPFRMPRDQFYGSLKKVALAPVRTPPDLEGAPAAQALFQGLVEERLRAAGLAFVPASEVGPILEEVAASTPGVFDPKTGKLDEAKARALRQEGLRRLREKFGVDALLRADLRVVNARLDRDTAAWDGTTERANTGFWKELFGGSHSGRIAALSLVVWLSRASDAAELYVNAGGLRVLGRVGVGGKVEQVAHAELFADPQRNRAAVDIALNPLFGLQPPAPE